jgi:hypothetical protein
MDTEPVFRIIAMLDAKISLYERVIKTDSDLTSYDKYELSIAIDTLKAFRDDIQEGIIEPLVTQAENKLGE